MRSDSGDSDESSPSQTPTTTDSNHDLDPSFDLTAVIDQVHFAYRPDAHGRHTAEHTTYGVRVDAGRVTLTPYHHPREVAAARTFLEGSDLDLETTQAGRGTATKAAATASSVGSTGELRIDRGPVTEILRNGRQGVEQSWQFGSVPDGDGDVIVRVSARGQRFVGTTDSGLHFRGDRNGLGFRYGHGTWVDARGAKTPVVARWAEGEIELRVPETVVKGAAYPAVLDPVVGPEIDIDVSALPPASFSQSAPAVAGGGAGTWLVAWVDDRGPTSDVYGARVSAAGQVLDGSGIQIAVTAEDETRPALAYGGPDWLVAYESNGAVRAVRVGGNGGLVGSSVAIGTGQAPDVAFGTSGWLVVWDNTNGIYGTRVATNGTLSDGAGFLLSNAAGDERDPAVAFGSTDWLVVWGDGRQGYQDIYATRVDGVNRTVLEPAGIELAPNALSRDTPDVAFNGSEWLVVSQAVPLGNEMIMGQRVTQGGALAGPEIYDLGASSGYQRNNPKVSANGSEWLVVWEKPRQIWNVQGVRLAANGTQLASPFWMGASRESQRFPVAASNGTDWLVAWAEIDIDATDESGDDVYATRISGADGSIKDPDPGFPVATVTSARAEVDVSFDGSDQWLVVWEDVRHGNRRHIHGVRVDDTGALLDPAGIMVSGGSNDEVPKVAHGGAEWLVVWDANGPGVAYARVGASGTVTPGPLVSTSHADPHPDVASDGAGWFVVFNDTGIDGRRVATNGTLLDATNREIDSSIFAGWPRAAHNGTHYLVVWGVGGAVRGARVDGSGGIVGSPNLYLGPGWFDAHVASNGDDWFVAWSENRVDGSYRIGGTRVDGQSGSILDPAGITISDVITETADYPTVTQNGRDWVVVWRNRRLTGPLEYRYRATRVRRESVLDAPFDVTPALTLVGRPAVSGGSTGKSLVVYANTTAVVAGRAAGHFITFECTPTADTDATCNGVDEDCDGSDDDEYARVTTNCGVGACASTGRTSCTAGAVTDDCAPGTPAAADATCNGVDDDCGGASDEDYVPSPTSCGLGACAASGTLSCSAGVERDTCIAGTAAPNDVTCDGVDDDCDGPVDEDCSPDSGTEGGPGGGVDAGDGGADAAQDGATDGAGRSGGDTGAGGLVSGGSSGTTIGGGGASPLVGTGGRSASANGAGGMGGAAGSAAAGGSSGAPVPKGADAGGCGCRTASTRSGFHGFVGVAFGLAILLRRRRVATA